MLVVRSTLVRDHPIGIGDRLDSERSGAAQIQVALQQAFGQLSAFLRDRRL